MNAKASGRNMLGLLRSGGEKSRKGYGWQEQKIRGEQLSPFSQSKPFDHY